MNIQNLIKDAEVIDAFPMLSEKEKRIADQKGIVSAAIISKMYDLDMSEEQFANHIGLSPEMISQIIDFDLDFTMDMLQYLHKKSNCAFNIVVLPGDLPKNMQTASSLNLWDSVFSSQKIIYFQSGNTKINNDLHELSLGGFEYAPIC